MAAWTTKDAVLEAIERERAGWEALVTEVGKERMTRPGATGDWTFTDVVAHLNGWRVKTVAKLEAAARGDVPPAPPWPPDWDDGSDAGNDRINDWIFQQNRGRPPTDVLADAGDQFRRLLAAAQALPERDLFEPGRFAWMDGEPLSAVLDASFGHFHEEHEPSLRAWLREIDASG